jgi:hypothetical protein
LTTKAARTVFNAFQERLSSFGSRERVNGVVKRFLPSALPLPDPARSLLTELKESGNVHVPSPLGRDELLALRAELETRACFDAWRRHLGTFARTEAPEGTNNAHIVDVHSIPSAIRLANDPLVLSLVSNYLNCRPTIDDIVAWWSLPGRPAPKEEQFFHRDRDAIRFLKLFVYLSDVGEQDGPHVFIAGSHRSPRLVEVRRRYEDADVVREFPIERQQRHTGSFGTCFLEDTFGLHKGEMPKGTATRLLLQVRYTSVPSNFARRPTGQPIPRDYDPYINRFLF